MPALAITTSRVVILCTSVISLMAARASVWEELSILTMMRELPSPLGRELRDDADDGLRTAAMTVLFGRDRYVFVRPRPSPEMKSAGGHAQFVGRFIPRPAPVMR